MNADYWYLNEIREAVNSPESADADILREPAVAYAEAVRDLNERLQEVNKLLKKGLRTEAIHLAEQEPNLLDVVSELDFSLAEEWEGILAQWGMQLPPQIDTDIVANIEKAYKTSTTLFSLLRKHRLLSLAKAPLAARLRVLRNIQSRDSQNPAWIRDIREFEQKRLREIAQELREAKSQDDFDFIVSLREELHEKQWLSELPEELIQKTEVTFQQALSDNSRMQLEKILPQLEAAYSELQVDKAIPLAAKWNELLDTANLETDDESMERAEPSLNWVVEEQAKLQEQAQFALHLQNLEKALDDEAPASRIERLYHRAERFDEPIPQHLENRVVDRLSALHATSRRRTYLIASIIMLSIVLGGTFGILRWYQQTEATLVSQHTEKLNQLIEEKTLSSARDYADNLPKGLNASPALQEVLVRLRKLEADESQRSESFQALLSEAKAMDVANPDRRLLRELESLANTTIEKKEVAVIRSRVNAEDKNAKNSAQKAFQETLTKWSNKLRKLDSRAVTNDALEPAALRRTLRELISELESHSDIPASLRRQADPLLQKLNAIIDRESQFLEEYDSAKAVFSNVGNIDRYVAACERFTKRHPESLNAANLQNVLNSRAVWTSVVEWSKFWESYGPTWKNLDSETAAIALKVGNTLLGATEKNFLAVQFKERSQHLEKLVERSPDNLASLRLYLFSRPLHSQVKLVIDSDNLRYYTTRIKETTRGDRKEIRFSYYDGDTEPKNSARLANEILYSGESPQVVLVRRIEPIFDKIDNSNWDKSFHQIIRSILSSSRVSDNFEVNPPTLDPILALSWLRQICKAGSQGSLMIEHAYGPLVTEIEEAGIDLSVNWFLPKDELSEAVRLEAKTLLKGLSDSRVKRWEQVAGKNITPLIQAPARLPKWITCLDTKNGEPICNPRIDATMSGTLSLAAQGPSGHVSLKDVATVSKGQVTWIKSQKEVLKKIGIPLFFRPPSP